MFLILSNLRL